MGEPEDFVEQVNALRGGFNAAVGLVFLRATAAEVEGQIVVGPEHLQPYGLVHGGVYAGMIEALCSTGAALAALSDGRSAVGQENATSFIRAVRGGTLKGRAVPLVTGRRSQVWEARVHDDGGRLVAAGRVRLINLEPGARAGGETVALTAGEPGAGEPG